MNATFIYDGYEQWSSTINVHSYIYEHTSCMINDHRNSYDHWSSMIIDHNWHSNRSMIVAMECCWSYMISVDQWVISWSLPLMQLKANHATTNSRNSFWISHFWTWPCKSKVAFDGGLKFCHDIHCCRKNYIYQACEENKCCNKISKCPPNSPFPIEQQLTVEKDDNITV